MLNLGSHHPDLTYPNDAKQAKLALVLTFVAAIVCVLVIFAVLG